MKKAVVTILLVLPFILIVMISFASRIVSNFKVIDVESVCFIDDLGDCLDEDETYLSIGLNAKLDLSIRIFPELSTNKRVTYVSNNEEICKVDENGIVTGIKYGVTSISVLTRDGNKKASVYIDVRDDYVSSISVSESELELSIGQIYYLRATIDPVTALNKNVVWTSSNEHVASVNANGRVVAISAGNTTITVTTIDGGHIATCEVLVKEEVDFKFVDYEEGKGIYLIHEGVVNLASLLEYNEDLVNIEEVDYRIKSGSSNATLDGNLLTINENAIVVVEARVKDSVYISEITLKYVND